MLRDVFYYGKKPNVHPREKFAKNLSDARKQATTEHFWIINEFCDYKNFDWDFDFEYLADEDVWAEHHNNVWPSQHQKDSGTWLCSKKDSEIIIYRNDVDIIKRKNEVTNNWKLLENIDTTKWDFSWHPDPSAPPYIYQWGCKFFPVELKACLEYRVEGATQIKYMTTIVELLPNWECIKEIQEVDKWRWDMSWRPDPMDTPYIYIWGNKYVPGTMRSTLEYHVPGATEKKYMPDLLPVMPEWDRWEILHDIDKSSFDFTWRPDPREPSLIYVFGNDQHDGTVMPTVQYVMPEATEKKYLDIQKAKLAPHPERFEHLENASGIDYTWVPDPTSPPYIYAWGNQWNKPEDKISIQYVVEGATEYKYMEERSKRKPCLDNWIIPDNVDTTGFDFSWEPSPAEPPYIYQFGTQWQKDGGPRYVVKDATEIKYIEFQKVKATPTTSNWTVPKNIDVTGFDFSWHPDEISPPYIYIFATQWALTGGPVYTVPGATEKKYVEYPTAVALSDKSNWDIPEYIDSEHFDFSWHPFAEDDPCIYQIGTQWQKTGGPRYIVPGTDEMSPVKYIDRRIIKSKRLSDKSKFKILHPIIEEEFDFTWHPDTTEQPYIYVFGNQHYSAEKMPTVEYHVEGATQYKYVNDLKAKLAPSKNNWVINIKMAESVWDFTWVPDPGEPPYIYVFGNQWHDAEIESTIEYHVPDATEKKYINDIKATALPDISNWKFNYKIDKKKFDFSWRPDPGSPPYIYVFGSNLYPAEEMSCVEYHVPNATDYKYVPNIVAQLAEDKTNWIVPDNVDVTDFDFSWHPNPKDPAYIYYAGTQWQKTGGPKYVVNGATEIKYLENRKVKALANKDKWVLPPNVDVSDFDFSWHPDDTEPPYIYQFGTQWALTGGPKYVMPDATEVKYMDNPVAKALPDKTNWIVPENIDSESFDFSWHPYVEDQPYIYVFGTQWQKTGGPRYVTPGADEMSPVKYIDRRILKSKRLPDKSNWEIPANIDPNTVDYSWHPDDTEQPYIYEFGTQWHDRGGPKYVVPDATAMKYSIDIKGKLIKERDNWEILTPIVEETFDFSWHPHPNDPPFIYVFGNNLYPAEEMETVRYVVEGATQVKYINDVVATLAEDKTNWEVPEDVDTSNFDFTWKPHPKAPSYIYEFGTQWQKTGGPRYVVPGAKEVNYIPGSKAVYKPKTRSKYWGIPESLDISEFDFSWHPDKTDKAYIYQFGTQWAMSGGPRYVVPGATEIKYMDNPVAKMKPNKSNWQIPKDIDVDSFDFSWHPYIEDQAYIYQFGTQWQKTGGPRYVTPGADEMSPVKYIDRRILKAKKLPNKEKFEIIGNQTIEDFDYSWHPDDTEPPYIYIFGNEKYSAEIMPTVQYIVEGAKTKKYVNDVKAKLGINKSNWKISDDLDTTNFDFSWIPDPNDPPYIYEFGTQWQKTGGPRYEVKGATEIKYVDGAKAIIKQKPKDPNWNIVIPVKDFDYSWHPDNTEEPYIYVFGNELYDGEIMPTVKYIVPGARKVKYIKEVKAKLQPNTANWHEILPIDKTTFDFSWVPDPTSPPYIYVFGNQWNRAEIEPTIEYIVPGATDKKYVHDIVANVLPDKSKFKLLKNIVDDGFDFSWRPDPNDPPYIYVFGNQWFNAEKMPTIEYVVGNATDRKYVNDICAKLAPSYSNWREILPVDKTKFDFSWVPDPHDPPYIYVFGNQWNHAELEPTIEYVVPGGKEKKYVQTTIAHALPNRENFEVLLDIENFDYSWRPNPTDPPYTYVFGNQWNTAEKEPTVRYKHKNGSDIKYVNDVVATVRSNMKSWQIPEGFDVENFDFSWRPDPYDPAYIYEFATEYADRGGPKYVVDGATETKYMSYIKAKLRAVAIPKYYIETTLDELVSWHPTETFWALQKSIRYDNFDFNWRPTKDIEKYVNVFGSPDSELTQTYFINGTSYIEGNKEKNFIQQETKADSTYLAELFVQPDIFLVDRGNPETQARFEQLKARFTNVSKTRFLNSWVDTINRCINRSNTEVCWILNSELDYSNFDFKYYPNPWQMKMVHVFGTQWSHWGTTFMVNRDTFTEDTKYIKVIEHLSNLNFVKERRAVATNNLYDIIVINHGNKECDKVVASLEARACGKKVSTYDYDISYANTIKKIVNNLNAKKEQFVWIASSVCSYGEFDFTYICDPFARDSLHVFPSDRQKFGDTFLLDVNKAKEFIDNLELLQQYPKVNYNQTIRAKRLSAPVIKTGQDTHVEAIKIDFDFPYVIFQTEDITTVDNEPMNLWASDTKSILITSTGGTRIIVPKEAKDYVKDQLYDYPYIKTASKLLDSKPLDIVFLSNGEKCADENYEHLLAVTKGLKNRVVRVDGVDGRVDAYHAAVKAGQTNWSFTVFAKLKVDSKFDWNWQPDRLQIPKHYIFHAKNPINGLEYGHQGMIAYNKSLTLNNFGDGLDFTLDDPHETVELLSGIATFNTDAYSTWRTSFREVIKLKSDYTDISQERLKVWLTKAKGKYAKDCLQGASDAVEYYDEVNGDIDQLKLSYEWAWLKDYYDRKYK